MCMHLKFWHKLDLYFTTTNCLKYPDVEQNNKQVPSRALAASPTACSEVGLLCLPNNKADCCIYFQLELLDFWCSREGPACPQGFVGLRVSSSLSSHRNLLAATQTRLLIKSYLYFKHFPPHFVPETSKTVSKLVTLRDTAVAISPLNFLAITSTHHDVPVRQGQLCSQGQYIFIRVKFCLCVSASFVGGIFHLCILPQIPPSRVLQNVHGNKSSKLCWSGCNNNNNTDIYPCEKS